MPKTETLDHPVVELQTPASVRGSTRHPRWMQTAGVLFMSLALASAASHLLAAWLELSPPPSGYIGAYRRAGPEAGPQVFCAGSSLMVAALSWSEVSQAFGQGIETWSVAGSSPDIWEQWQQQRTRSTTTIIGVSVFDL